MKRLATMLALLLAPALPAAAETIKLRLQDLTALKKLELRCVSDVKEIAVPVPERWTVKRMDLHLRYTVSTNLLPESSQLVVKVAGNPVAPRPRSNASIVFGRGPTSGQAWNGHALRNRMLRVACVWGDQL